MGTLICSVTTICQRKINVTIHTARSDMLWALDKSVMSIYSERYEFMNVVIHSGLLYYFEQRRRESWWIIVPADRQLEEIRNRVCMFVCPRRSGRATRSSRNLSFTPSCLWMSMVYNCLCCSYARVLRLVSCFFHEQNGRYARNRTASVYAIPKFNVRTVSGFHSAGQPAGISIYTLYYASSARFANIK